MLTVQAFPVLCRILTELKLLMTPVGVIVLSAGVGNDVVGKYIIQCIAIQTNNIRLDSSCALRSAR
jgi:Kef-type K+ transport system membrane component KefB